jgi:hypothetical protein
MYTVEDREDKDRKNALIDSFKSRQAAENYAAEWSRDYGHCTVHDKDGNQVSAFNEGKRLTEISNYMRQIGRKGGSQTSEAKRAAAKRNIAKRWEKARQPKS